jgi:hypothetical protein
MRVVFTDFFSWAEFIIVILLIQFVFHSFQIITFIH